MSEVHASINHPDHPQPETPRTNRAAVNRANAKLSTGPSTPEGKARSSMNALRHGLTARAILLPTDDPAANQHHTQGFFDEYQPQGASEQQLVQSLADTAWRLNRVARLEAALFSAGATPEEDETRALETQIRALTSLSMHSHRLSRQFENTLKQLREIQKERRKTEESQLEKAANLLQMDQDEGVPFHPAADGFVFSKTEIETFIRRRKRAKAAVEAAFDRKEAEEEQEEED